MGLDKYLLEEEKKNIKNISEAQSFIIERREILKRTINGIEKKNFINKKTDKCKREYVSAFQKVLEKEGFLKKEELYSKVKIKKNEEKVLKSYEINFFKNILLDFNTFNKGVLTDLSGGFSNIDKIDKILIQYQEFSKQISKFEKTDELDLNLGYRIKGINGNIINLIQILGESKNDMIDYFSNKNKIINLLKLLNNGTNSFLKDI